MYVATIPCK